MYVVELGILSHTTVTDLGHFTTLQRLLATWLSLRGGRPFLLLSRSFSLCCRSFSRSRDLDLLDLRSLDLDRRLLSRDLDLDRRRLFGDLQTNARINRMC